MATFTRDALLSGMAYPWILGLILIVGCTDDTVTSVVGDADALAALKNVAFEVDALTLEIRLPDLSVNGPVSGAVDWSDLPDDPAAYGVGFSIRYTADNTRDNARDARFDGMRQQVIVHDLEDHPVHLAAESFTIPKHQVLQVSAGGAIDLESHRLPVLHIFRQMVDGEPVRVDILTDLLYTIGPVEGSIRLPRVEQEIPTRASDAVKEVLAGLLASGRLDQP